VKSTDLERGQAFAVHLFTASGAAFAVLAALAVVQYDWRTAFIWLGLALIVDGIDGPIARKLRVRERLPNWDGSALDFVIDYTTYVFIPAVILALGCGLTGVIAAVAGVAVAVSGALYFADSRMKQPDNSFRGFPAVWNMVVFVIFVVGPPPLVTLGVVLLFAVATFLPVNFVHPVRVVRWRPLTVIAVLAWLAAAGWSLATNFVDDDLANATLIVTSLYLMAVSAIQQLLRHMDSGKWRR